MATVDLRRTEGRATILDAAARLFYERGYAQTSIRAIASASGVESSSLYYHFPSKEDILFAVEEEAFRRLAERIIESLEGLTDPWERLTTACVTHVRAILENREFVTITTKELPQNQTDETRQKFIQIRDRYEDLFRGLIEAVGVRPSVSRKYVRLTLIGALAGSLLWYRDGGEDNPEDIALNIVSIIRYGCDPKRSGRT